MKTKRITLKLFTLVLTVLLVFSTIGVSAIVVGPDDYNAFDGDIPEFYGAYTVVFSSNIWDNPYIFAENSLNGNVVESYDWPGEKMRYGFKNVYGEYVFVAYIPKEYDSIIISCNNERTEKIALSESCGIWLKNQLDTGEYGVGYWNPRFEKYEGYRIFVGYRGDVDRNGDVNILDVTLLQKHLADFQPDSYNDYVGDADGSESINIKDATIIQKWIAELPLEYHIGAPMFSKV